MWICSYSLYSGCRSHISCPCSAERDEEKLIATWSTMSVVLMDGWCELTECSSILGEDTLSHRCIRNHIASSRHGKNWWGLFDWWVNTYKTVTMKPTLIRNIFTWSQLSLWNINMMVKFNIKICPRLLVFGSPFRRRLCMLEATSVQRQYPTQNGSANMNIAWRCTFEWRRILY